MSPCSADAADRFERGGASTGSFAAQALSPAHVGSAVYTGLTRAEAEGRVTMHYEYTQAKLAGEDVAASSAADKACQAAAHVALWLFVSLLGVAFVASLAATWGGRLRDA